MRANTLEVLSNLIEINLDRVIDYEKALRELKEEKESPDIVSLFDTLTKDSDHYKKALGGYFQF